MEVLVLLFAVFGCTLVVVTSLVFDLDWAAAVDCLRLSVLPVLFVVVAARLDATPSDVRRAALVLVADAPDCRRTSVPVPAEPRATELDVRLPSAPLTERVTALPPDLR